MTKITIQWETVRADCIRSQNTSAPYEIRDAYDNDFQNDIDGGDDRFALYIADNDHAWLGDFATVSEAMRAANKHHIANEGRQNNARIHTL